ncbi:hypothetical protein C8R45DRAFT_1214962 [Mycena sanguinolenta]|nr:hypothetical protein C8R45DRAFT_1214962 [Mycena sanguinolenta]
MRPRRFFRGIWPTHAFRGLHNFLPYSTEENRDSLVMQRTGWRGLHDSVIRHPRSLLRRASTCIPLSAWHKNGPPLFDSPFPNQSPEVAAVSWVLETSTDPAMVTFAAEMAVQLQWPLDVDLAPQISRLRDTVLGCFEYRGVYKLTDDGPVNAVNLDRIREGMADRVIRCGQAYCSLRALVQSLSKEESTICCADYQPFESPEPRNVVRILTGSPELMFDSIPPTGIEWTLRVYMALEPSHLPNRGRQLQHFLDQTDKIGTADASSFTEYLFCIHAFLNDTNRMDLIRRDKSLFQEQLFEYLFKTLAVRLETAEISMETAANILDTTGRLAARSGNNVWSHGFGDYYRQSIIYPFCGSLRQKDGWLGIVFATGSLAKNQSYSPCPGISRANHDVAWIYDALESVLGLAESGPWDTEKVSGLLQALLFYDIPPYREDSTDVKNPLISWSGAMFVSGFDTRD